MEIISNACVVLNHNGFLIVKFFIDIFYFVEWFLIRVKSSAFGFLSFIHIDN